MFGEKDKFEEPIDRLLEVYSIEEALEVLDITPQEVLSILFNNGYVCLPPWLENNMEDIEDKDEWIS